MEPLLTPALRGRNIKTNSLITITTSYPRGWGALAMKNYHRDIHAAEDEKERKIERQRGKEETEEQKNSAFRSLLQVMSEQKNSWAVGQANTNIAEDENGTDT